MGILGINQKQSFYCEVMNRMIVVDSIRQMNTSFDYQGRTYLSSLTRTSQKWQITRTSNQQGTLALHYSHI